MTLGKGSPAHLHACVPQEQRRAQHITQPEASAVARPSSRSSNCLDNFAKLCRHQQAGSQHYKPGMLSRRHSAECGSLLLCSQGAGPLLLCHAPCSQAVGAIVHDNDTPSMGNGVV